MDGWMSGVMDGKAAHMRGGGMVVTFGMVMPVHCLAVLVFKGFKMPKEYKRAHHRVVNERAAKSAVLVQHRKAQSLINGPADDVGDELLSQGPDAVSAAVSLAAKEAHKNSMNYAKERMTELYSEIGLPMPPKQWR